MKKLFFILFVFLSFQGFSQTDIDYSNQNPCDISATVYVISEDDIDCERVFAFTTVPVLSGTSYTVTIPGNYYFVYTEITDDCNNTIAIKPQSFCEYPFCPDYDGLDFKEQEMNSCCEFIAEFASCNEVYIH